MHGLVDLDELVIRCRSEQAKRYIAEAVECYKVGAYRASIVTTWIAIVFDIIDKIRELAITGDQAAITRLKEFENRQEQLARGDMTAIEPALRFERQILLLARDDLQLIDHQQFLDLERLREDRNRCAHPTFQRVETPYIPSSELARTHLRNAIVHVLQQQPVQGKAALTELQTLVESKYFPSEVDKAKTQLGASSLSRPKDALIISFVDYLIYGFFNGSHPLGFKRRTLSALDATLELHAKVAEPRFGRQANKIIQRLQDVDMRGAVALTGTITRTWDLLSTATRDKIKMYLQHGPGVEVADMLRYAMKVPELKSISVARISEFGIEELSVVITKDVTDEVLERIVDLFSHASNWVNANNIAAKLVLPVLPQLTQDHIIKIIRAPMDHGADLRGSIGFANFMERIQKENLLPRAELISLLEQLGMSEYMEDEEAAESQSDGLGL